MIASVGERFGLLVVGVVSGGGEAAARRFPYTGYKQHGERCSRLDLFDAVDWLEELDHELVEAHAEHCCRLFELLGGE